ncbi:TPA: host nuclease inhibitor GamL, partial [Klebsiella pneumoniae]|nr:host nuclease inhibitor GamL [Klebsiella pneumoniae]HBU3421344.1 host nuclease inhibitor GamL [Klebsiella pneumoniae]
MNAYRAYDVIEERKWAEQLLTEEKEEWIDDRAKEVFDSLPEDPYAALRQSASSRAFPYEGLRSDKAVEVYNDLRTA